MNKAMRVWKQDVMDGIYKQPSSIDWEDERQCFIPKEDGIGNIPILDHKGNWGQGYSSDLMRSGGYVYQGIMSDFGIEGAIDMYISSVSKDTDGKVVAIKSNSTFDQVIKSSRSRFGRVRRKR
jgi:hypothetical protein